MRVLWGRVRWLGVLLFGVSGCWTTQPELKPPKQPEVIAVPPQEDARFSQPIQYPKGTLNQEPTKKSIKTNDPNNPAGAGAPRFGPSGASGAGPMR